jgi:AcrR family transcriptional regulator
MAQQARSEATRKKIIDAAVELFGQVGYSVTGLGDIIERAELTKGALYYHFDSKESLASAIIAEAASTITSAVDNISQSSAPVLENIIHNSFVVADIVRADSVVRIGAQLARVLGEFNSVAIDSYSFILAAMTAQLRQAATEGDLRPDLDPAAAAETLLSTYLGAELLATGLSRGDNSVNRLMQMWAVLLPALTADDALAYFLEFLTREGQRHSQQID